MNFANILLENVRTSVISRENRNSRRRAIHSALMAVNCTHPDYAGVGFDTKFMTNEAAALMRPFLNGGPVPTADDLVFAAWLERFSHFDENVKRTAATNITPLVDDFVYVLASKPATLSGAEQATLNKPIISQRSGGYITELEYGTV